MKKLLSLATAWGLCVPIFASMNMYVKQKDGNIVTFDVESVEEVYYGEGDSPIIETPIENPGESINDVGSMVDVEAGGKYFAYNPSIEGGNLQFEVVYVSGEAGSKIVEFIVHLKGDEADGKTFVIGDDSNHSSYFGRINGKLQSCSQKIAENNALNIIFALSSEAYTYKITSATINNRVAAAGALRTDFGVVQNIQTETPKDDDPIVETPQQSYPQIQVQAGGVYTVSTPLKEFSFRVKSVEGSYMTRDQIVVIEINGLDYMLSDAGNSYLMMDGDEFYTSNTVMAKSNVSQIVACLACANSTADYTIASPTLNDTMRDLGAIESSFSQKSEPIMQETKKDESIQVVAGGKYYAKNPNKNFYFSVQEVSGSYADKNQFVIVRIDGSDYVLSDEGDSYLMWTPNGFITANKKTADANSKDVVMILACANSTADYTITSPRVNTTLNYYGAYETTFSVDDREKAIEEIVGQQELKEIQVVEGGEYGAVNPSKTFSFRVVEVNGSYMSKNQAVVIEIDGYDEYFTLSDAGNSYLMWTGTYFVTANTATAKNNAKNIVMVLACANSTADYTITSATVNYTMNQLGATETLFGKK